MYENNILYGMWKWDNNTYIYIYFFFLKKKSFALVILSPIPSEEFGNYIFKT